METKNNTVAYGTHAIAMLRKEPKTGVEEC
jgi:hypothetical protein